MREKGYLLSSYERVRVIVKRKSKEKREKAKETTHVLLQNISQREKQSTTKEEENNNNNKYNKNVCKRSARCKKKRQADRCCEKIIEIF